jgi:hypothetical protein
VLVGPRAHLNGTEVADGCFLATGCALFPGSRLGPGAEVRIHGVVQVNTVPGLDAVVPIGWVAVGDPAQVFARAITSASGRSRRAWTSRRPSMGSGAKPRRASAGSATRTDSPRTARIVRCPERPARRPRGAVSMAV